MPAGQPKPLFYVAVGAVVLALVAFAVWRSDIFAPKARTTNPDIDLKELTEKVEQPGAGTTTVQEYKFVPAEVLPPVPNVSEYKAMKDNTVRFPLNVWAGWAPIILANEGFAAGKEWKTPDGKPFKVELVTADDPVKM